MRMLGTRFPDGRLNGSAMTPDGRSGPVAHAPEQLPTPQATRPLLAGTLIVTRQASGFITRLNQTQGQRLNRMTPPMIPLFEYLESPQDAIDIPVAFPREPEPKQDICPILRLNQGDRIPEKAPAIARTETETETEIATETATVPAVADPEAITNPEAVAPAVAVLVGTRNPLP